MAMNQGAFVVALNQAFVTYHNNCKPLIEAQLTAYFQSLSADPPPYDYPGVVPVVAEMFAKAFTTDLNGSPALATLVNDLNTAVYNFVSTADVTVLPGDVGLQTYFTPAAVPTGGPLLAAQITGGLS